MFGKRRGEEQEGGTAAGLWLQGRREGKGRLAEQSDVEDGRP
jgi:hypothetical protein